MKIYKFLFFISVVLLIAGVFSFTKNNPENKLPEILNAKSVLIRTDQYFAYRDLNKNGKLDVYEDEREPIEKTDTGPS